MRRIVLLLLAVSLPGFAGSIDTQDLSELVGYTVIAATHVRGEFDGADWGKLVGLDNRMVFEFQTTWIHIALHPDAIVFALHFTADEARKSGLKSPEAGLTDYKLLIDDHIYDVRRVR